MNRHHALELVLDLGDHIGRARGQHHVLDAIELNGRLGHFGQLLGRLDAVRRASQ